MACALNGGELTVTAIATSRMSARISAEGNMRNPQLLYDGRYEAALGRLK